MTVGSEDLENEDKFKCVFIHEVGHYIAYELNNKKTTDIKVDKINLEWWESRNDYLGRIVLNDKTWDSTENIKENLSLYITALVYGCFIQSVYLNFKIDNCSKERGLDDFRKVTSALNISHNSNRDVIRNKIIELLEQEKRNFKNKRDQFKTVFNIDYLELTEKEDNLYKIDLKKLKVKLKSFIGSHEHYYFSLLDKIEVILLS